MASLVALVWLVPEATASECPMRIQEVQTASERGERLLQDRKVSQGQLETRLAHARRLLEATAQHHAEGQHDAAIAKAMIALRTLQEPKRALENAKKVQEAR
jgi:hypothetical protein